MAPVTLLVIVLLLYLALRQPVSVAIVLGTLPLALVGGVWTLHLLDYQLSVAVGVGFIALAGVAVDLRVMMVTYLRLAMEQWEERARANADGRGRAGGGDGRPRAAQTASGNDRGDAGGRARADHAGSWDWDGGDAPDRRADVRRDRGRHGSWWWCRRCSCCGGGAGAVSRGVLHRALNTAERIAQRSHKIAPRIAPG